MNKMKTKCIIVDDEPLAIEAIEIHLKNFNSIEIAGTFRNAIDAMEFIHTHKIDLIFLDIQMPKITGLEFLKSLNNPPKVIITTAYRDYAVEGFDLDVIDYLLKPIHFDRFVKAIDKYYKSLATEMETTSRLNMIGKDYIFLRIDRKDVKVFFDDILFIEAMKDYVQIHLKSGRLINKNTVSNLEKLLPGEKFVRVHRSYIVSVAKIDAISTDGVEIGKKVIPVSKNYRDRIDKLIRK